MNYKIKKAMLLGVKIGFGTAFAIAIASWLNLQSPTSAGTITLLTLLTTKRGTLKLSFERILTFGITTILAFMLFDLIPHAWTAFAILIFLIVCITEVCSWKWTLSVNAMIAIHFLVEQDFTMQFIWNEFCLLLVGIVMAIALNFIQTYSKDENALYEAMHYSEHQIQKLLKEICEYIQNPDMSSPVWGELTALEKKIQEFLVQAIEYQENTYASHPQYFIDYFEMREFQCEVLHMLHYEIRKIRTMPQQAHIISDYIEYLIPFVTTANEPEPQLEVLERLLDDLRSQALPTHRDEFESRAILYHILMDLEDFLLRKKQFLSSLDAEQRLLYDHISE